MKKYILSVLFLCAAFCQGQQRDELKSFPAFKAYLDSLRLSNDKNMAMRGYVKAIDSIPLPCHFPEYMDSDRPQVRHYQLADSAWLNHDTTYFIFRYFTKLKKTKQDIQFERYFSNY